MLAIYSMADQLDIDAHRLVLGLHQRNKLHFVHVGDLCRVSKHSDLAILLHELIDVDSSEWRKWPRWSPAFLEKA